MGANRIGMVYTKLPEVQVGVAKSGGSPSGAAELPAGADDGVKVQVSTEAVRLAESAKGGINEPKVNALRESIAAGTFEVDAEAIAERILDGGG